MRVVATLAFAATLLAGAGVAAADPPVLTKDLTVGCFADEEFCHETINQEKDAVDAECAFGVCEHTPNLPNGPLTDEQADQVLDWIEARQDLSEQPYRSSIQQAFKALWP